MSDTFTSMTELGKQFGVSGLKIGKALIACGLRTPEKKPSTRAFRDGYVEQRSSTQPGTYFWVWNAEKTIDALQAAGFTKLDDNEDAPMTPPDSSVPG